MTIFGTSAPQTGIFFLTYLVGVVAACLVTPARLEPGFATVACQQQSHPCHLPAKWPPLCSCWLPSWKLPLCSCASVGGSLVGCMPWITPKWLAPGRAMYSCCLLRAAWPTDCWLSWILAVPLIIFWVKSRFLAGTERGKVRAASAALQLWHPPGPCSAQSCAHPPGWCRNGCGSLKPCRLVPCEFLAGACSRLGVEGAGVSACLCPAHPLSAD